MNAPLPEPTEAELASRAPRCPSGQHSFYDGCACPWRAISLWQPYASLVALGYKTFETRLWPTEYRGDFLVASTKAAAPRDDYDRVMAAVKVRGLPTFGRLEQKTAPRGVMLAVVHLADCRPMTPADERDAWIGTTDPSGKTRFVWTLENLRPVTWAPVTGKQGWFKVPRQDVTFEKASS